MVPLPPSAETGRRLLASLAVLSAVVAALALLFVNPLADVFVAAWVAGSVLLALVGGVAAWANRTPLAGAAALLLTGLSLAGMMSVGLFVAPSAAFLLGAALLSWRAGPREGVTEAIAANPPTVRETVLRALLGVGSIALGAGLVFVTAFGEGLFEACASETLACTVENTHWLAVGGTVLGLVAVGVGGWLVWKQLYVARVRSISG